MSSFDSSNLWFDNHAGEELLGSLPASQIPLHATKQRACEGEPFAEGKLMQTVRNIGKLGLCFSVYRLLCCPSKFPAEKDFMTSVPRWIHQVSHLWQGILKAVFLVYAGCNKSGVTAWPRVSSPDQAWEVIFTVLKVQLGTSVLLTTIDFHHLILCSFWLCWFC